MDTNLRLEPGCWYVWQMYPGYSGTPYISPIRIEEVTPLKTGRKELRVSFYNAFYAQGVRDFSPVLRLFVHHPRYIMAAINPGSDSIDERACTIIHFTPMWEELLVPELAQRWQSHPPSDKNIELDEYLMDD